MFRRNSAITRALLIAALLSAAAGCGSRKPRQPAIGEGYVAPISLNLRAELSRNAPLTAAVKHGERLEILERRRRFVKVRTAQDEEGWTDSRQLLSPKGMARLRRASERARLLPSQGTVVTFDKLNVHIEPNRQSPSFHQLPENGSAELIGRTVTARVPYVAEGERQPAPEPNALKDDWSLIRLNDGRSGWVLSRMLMMNLPDEVTQYAEGHRITSHFSLGTVESRGQKHHHWLWTTIAVPPETHQFDGFRVFVYSTRRHRYETAHRERNLRGYYPVVVEPAAGSDVTRFSLIFAGRDGALARRTYEFNGLQVRLVAKEPWELPPPERDDVLPQPSQPESAPRPASTRERFAAWFRNLLRL